MTRSFFAAVCIALAACAPKFDPPPGYVGGFLWNSDKSRTAVVQPGDTLYTISRRYDAPTKAIAARNGLSPPYALTVGQTLILDPARRHTVTAGQTLNAIANIYDVDLGLIAATNDLREPFVLRPGQELWIPDPFTQAAQPTRNERGDIDVAEVAVPPPVRSGIKAESLPPPPGAPAIENTPAPLPPPASAPSPKPTPRAQPGPAPVDAPDEPSTEETQVAVVPPSQLPDPAPRAAARFARPISGKVIANFGPAGGGLHNDGINIAAPLGTEVRAADNGVIAYAGNELRGFGNLLLIKHADGWTTAYAHNEKLLVKRGDAVTQGQVIATVGRTGNVDSPQLHFEVRKGTQAMNPVEFLAAR
ncbi:MAG: peptidoglycan DD-metalloendopeptidase family protein [Rhodospirillaceae bacterium]